MKEYEYEYVNILLTNQSALPASLCSELGPASPVPSPSQPFIGVTRVASCSYSVIRKFVQGL